MAQEEKPLLPKVSQESISQLEREFNTGSLSTDEGLAYYLRQMDAENPHLSTLFAVYLQAMSDESGPVVSWAIVMMYQLLRRQAEVDRLQETMDKPSMVLEHMRCPLKKYTFAVRPIREWVESNATGHVLNLFAGQTKLACKEIRNDAWPEAPAHYHMDALDFVKSWTGDPFDTVILDPPYSYRKSMELYSGVMVSSFKTMKDHLPKIMSPGGRVITFGYHSVSMGATRGFDLTKILVISHGGAIHDTIATIERKK